MLGLGARIVSSFRELYNEINPATLTGAIDVIVVEQPDGSLKCTPFYVRFGKMGVMRSREKVVDITINDEPIEDLFMKLDDSGEAYFVEDTFEECEIPIELATSPLPNASAAQLMSAGLANLHKNINDDDEKLLNIKSRSVSPQPAQKEANLKVKKFSYTPEIKTVRTNANTLNKVISVDDEIGVRKQKKQKRKMTKLIRRENNERFRRERLRSSSWCSGAVEDLTIALPCSVYPDDKTNVDVNVDDDDEHVFVEKPNRKKLSKLKLSDNSNDAKSSSMVDESGRQMSGVWATPSEDMPSSPSFADASATVHDEMFQLDFGEEEAVQQEETVVVKSYESHDEEVPKSDSKSSGYASDSDTLSTGSSQSTPDSQQKQSKSVSFKTMDKTKYESAVPSTSGWGLSNMLGLGFMYRSKNVKEGIYLDDLLNSNKKEIDPKLASMYLENNSHLDRKRNSIENLNGDKSKPEPCQTVQQKLSASTEDDGYCSKPSSYVSTNHARRISHHLNQMKQSEFLTNVPVSLCDKGSASNLSDDQFERGKLVYEDFVKNPELLFSRKLIIKLNGNYYKYNVAVPFVVCSLLFQIPLPEKVLNNLCAKYKFNDVKRETTSAPKIIQPASLSDSNDTSSSYGGVGSWFSWRRAASAEPRPIENPQVENGHLKVSLMSAGSGKNNGNLHRIYGSAQYLNRSSFDERDALSDGELDHFATKSSRYRKTLFLTSDQLKSLQLRRDKSNHATFSVTTKYQGTCTCECYIYLWKWDDRIVISDVDGTITISDVLGHLMPIIGRQWEHENVASLFSSISDNGYKIVYLTARAIGQSQRTKDYLRSVKQLGRCLPDGPLQMSPVSLLSAFHREVIEKTPEIFKMKCLKDLRSIFPPNINPLYAGFGNRPNDEVAYRNSGIPTHKIFTINPSGSVSFLDNRLRSSYHHISEIMDHVFPPLYFTTMERRRKSVFTSPDQFSNFSYWRQQPMDVEIDIEKFSNSKDGKLTTKTTTKIVPKSRKNGIAGVP